MEVPRSRTAAATETRRKIDIVELRRLVETEHWNAPEIATFFHVSAHAVYKACQRHGIHAYARMPDAGVVQLIHALTPATSYNDGYRTVKARLECVGPSARVFSLLPSPRARSGFGLVCL